MSERVLDVRDLEPPEPLERALEAASALGAGERLRLIHWREPFPLYGMLDRAGFGHEVQAIGDRFEVLIWRKGAGGAG